MEELIDARPALSRRGRIGRHVERFGSSSRRSQARASVQ
jgi:hypothetical protein